jgi:antitoxin component YwqK of YwqJK toxin-antitoxin module
VPFDDLIVEDDQSLAWQGRPFTGVAYETDGAGRLISEMTYVDGQQSGVGREWYESGKLRSESQFMHGSKHGLSRNWYEDGALASESEYQYSIKTQEKTWDRGGAPVGDWSLPANDPQRALIDLLAQRFGVVPSEEKGP